MRLPDYFQKHHLVLEIVCLICLITFFAVLITAWPNIPDRIPTHYDFSGQVDGWGSKSSSLFLPILSLVLYLFLTVMEFFSRIWNFPTKVTEENRLTMTAMALDLLILIKLTVLILFFCLFWTSINSIDLPIWFSILWFVLLAAIIGWSTVRMVRVSDQQKQAGGK